MSEMLWHNLSVFERRSNRPEISDQEATLDDDASPA